MSEAFDDAMCAILSDCGCKTGDIEPLMALYVDNVIASASEKLLEIAEYLVEFNK